VFVSLLHDSGAVQREPAATFAAAASVSRREKHRVGRDAQETEKNDPGQAKGSSSSGQFPPREDPSMMNGILIDDVEEDVEVDELHLRSIIFLMISLSSNAAASDSALSSATVGTPMRKVCSR